MGKSIDETGCGRLPKSHRDADQLHAGRGVAAKRASKLPAPGGSVKPRQGPEGGQGGYFLSGIHQK
jgi:hypothetical protein